MAACVAVLAVDAAAVASRVDRVQLPRTHGAPGVETWVLAGVDSRASVPDGPDHYGPDDGAGVHADVVVVLAVPEAGPAAALVVPRDLLVTRGAGGPPARLGVLPARGWDVFASGLCLSLGIPVDHLVTVTMRGFADAVDALGGLDVTLPSATRDAYSGLDLPAGDAHLDGVQALSLVRSRHPEHLVDGRWVPRDAAAGAEDRTRWAGEALTQLAGRLRDVRSPVVVQRLAWRVSDDVVLDDRTSLADLARLRDVRVAEVVHLPVEPTGIPVVVTVGGSTREVLGGLGYAPGGCARDAG